MAAPITLIMVRGGSGDIHDRWSLHHCFELYGHTKGSKFIVVGSPSIVSDAAYKTFDVECVNTVEEATEKVRGRPIVIPSDTAIYLTKDNIGYGDSDLPNCHAVIVTVDRPGIEDYLDRLISTFGSRPITFMGGPSTEGAYLDKYRDDPRYKVIEQNPDIKMVKKIAVNYNFSRTFRHFASYNQLLVMENDIYYTKDWQNKLTEILKFVPFEKYVCTLYRPGKMVGNRGGNTPWVGVPWDEFSCSQSVYYHNVNLKELGEFIFSNGVEQFVDGADVLTGKYLETVKIPLIATVPSLVQHEGKDSCADTKLFHFSENFTP